MTLLQHIYAIKDLISKGPSSRDFKFSDEILAHYITIERADLIQNKLNKYHHISEASYQTLCLDLTKQETHPCCDTKVCTILRSTKQLPETINARFGEILKVTDLLGNLIPYIDQNTAKLSKYSIAAPKIGYFIQDGFLYIVLNSNLEKVLVTGLFTKTVEDCSDSTPCDPLEKEFPIDSDLISALYTAVQKRLLLLNTRNETKNDARDNIL